MSKVVIGADTETHDELLKTAGYSWKYNKGYVLCTSLYYEADDKTEVIAGLHNDNCPFTKEQREKQNETMISILKNPDVCLVGANIIYDIGWWCYEYGMSTYDVKCSFVDVLQAEAILDEEYGVMIGVINGKIKRVPLEECAGKLKMVSPKDQIVKAAKQIGISFGD